MWLLHRKGYVNINKNTVIEHNVGLDKLNRKGIHIGSGCLIASGTTILAHEHIFVKPDGSYYMKDTYIGNNCFIGVRSMICLREARISRMPLSDSAGKSVLPLSYMGDEVTAPPS